MKFRFLQKAGLPIDFFDRKTRSLSVDEYFQLWEALVECADTNKSIPLLLEKLPIAAAMSPPILAALCSKDFDTFVNRIREFKPLIGPLVLKLESNEDTFAIGVTSVVESMEFHLEIVASEFVFFAKIIRDATGVRVVPVSVESRVPLDEDAYAAFFGIKLGSGKADRIIFSASDTRIPFSMRNESVWEYFEPELGKRLDELEKVSSFAARVRAVLFEILPMGQSAIDDVSGKLNMSNRTLQRRLQAEETNYQQQLNQRALGSHPPLII